MVEFVHVKQLLSLRSDRCDREGNTPLQPVEPPYSPSPAEAGGVKALQQLQSNFRATLEQL